MLEPPGSIARRPSGYGCCCDAFLLLSCPPACQVEDGGMILDVNMDEGLLDGQAAMVKFLRSASPAAASPA